MEMNAKRAVIYCRVSTKEQVDEGGSLGTQENICKEYAIKNGYTIIETFIEEGESAKTAKRTQLRRMLDFCSLKKNGISAVIAYKVDRIARNIDDYRQIRLVLKAHGVEIKSTSEFFEDTPAGRFMENIIANVAQFDNDVRTERSVNGMRDVIRDGRFCWYAPVGYENIKIGGKTNIAHSKTASLVRKAFEETAKNLKPVENIYYEMVKEGLINRKGKPVSKSYFYRMLSNELYAGWVIGLGERQKGIFEPIVTEELFEQVQRVLKRRKRRNTQYKVDNPDFPLRRFVAHPTGKKLTGCWAKGRAKKYPYYMYHINGMLFKKELLDASFMNYFDKFKLTEEQATKFRIHVKENLINASENKQKEYILSQKYIADLKGRQKALIQKNLDGVINDNILREQLALIDDEIIKVAVPTNTNPLSKERFEKLYKIVEEFLKKPSVVWEKAQLNGKLKLQWFNFPKGIVFDGEKFQTTEVCNLFKVEKTFCDTDSTWVTPLLSSSNTPEILNSIYWFNISKEIQDLAGIIQEIDTEKIFLKHGK